MTYYQSTHGHNHSIINGIGRIGTMWGGKSALWNDETMADEFAKQAKKYLAQFKTKKNTPFFLFWSAADIHVPRAPHPRFKGKSELSYRGDAMVQLDWCAGEIIKALEENGLSDNTIVIFSSDNGPVYDDGYDDDTTVKTSTKELDRGHDGSGQWRGGKYQIYEGGTRVPLIIRWPGKIKPGTTSAMVSQIDFIASFAEMLGVTLKPNQAIDSRNNLNALLGKDKLGTRILIQEARGIAIRDGDWKYISIYKQKKKKIAAQLYNLKTDPSEKNNLIKQHPKRTQEMQKMLTMKIRAEKGVRAMLSK